MVTIDKKSPKYQFMSTSQRNCEKNVGFYIYSLNFR